MKPRLLMLRIGPVLSVVPYYATFPRCALCGTLVASGVETLARARTGRYTPVCERCDATGMDDKRRNQQNERRYTHQLETYKEGA